MAAPRHILTRAAEAVYALLAADTDIMAEVGDDATALRLCGPSVEPTSLGAPGIDVQPIVQEKWEYSLGEITETMFGVRVTYWQKRSDATAVKIAPGLPIKSVDVPRHVVAVVRASGNGRGRLVDPDSAPSDQGTARYLNHGFGAPQFGVTALGEQTILGFYVDLVFDSSQDSEGDRA